MPCLAHAYARFPGGLSRIPLFYSLSYSQYLRTQHVEHSKSFARRQLHGKHDGTTSNGLSTDASDRQASIASQALALLHKTISFIPRVLPPKARSAQVTNSLEFRYELLAGARSALSSAAAGKVRVAVAGVGKWTGSEELVAALLEDPFVSDDTRRIELRMRWEGTDRRKPLRIENKTLTDVSGPPNTDTLLVSSSFLQELCGDVSLVDIPSSSQEAVGIHALCEADVPIICLNPIITPFRTILEDSTLPIYHRNAILVLNCASPSTNDLTTRLVSLLDNETPYLQLNESQIFFVDPARALSALEMVSSHPTSVSAIETFQVDFAASRILALKEFLVRTLKDPTRVQITTALAQISGALYACRAVIAQATQDVEDVHAASTRLAKEVDEKVAKTYQDVFGERGAEKAVLVALADAEKEIRLIMDDLTWWKILWCGVDDVSAIVIAALNRHWCRELEHNLIMHTGRLSYLQRTVASSAFTTVSSIPASSALHSGVLLNSLQQLITSPAYPLSPSSLTEPLHARKAQLATYSTTRLHLAAQRAVFITFGSLGAGAGVASASWAGWVGTGIDSGTALGIGMLCGLLGVRWAVGSWDKARRRWWADWTRVGEGLGRDLVAVLEKTMRENVLVVAGQATSTLHEMTARRLQEIDRIQADLQNLQDDLRAVEQAQDSDRG